MQRQRHLTSRAKCDILVHEGCRPRKCRCILILRDIVEMETRKQDLTAKGLFGEQSDRGLREEWSKWLTAVFQSTPTSLVTLTFANRPWESGGIPTLSRVKRAARQFENSLTRSLGVASYFIVLELGGWNGRRHLHSLISSPGGEVTFGALAGLARHAESEGFVSVRQVAMSAEEYVTKYVSKSDGDFWLAGGPLFHERAGSSFSGSAGDSDSRLWGGGNRVGVQ